MNSVFEVNSPAVVGEILDGEAVIMNLKSGNYFSTDKVGSMLWGMIEKGADYQTMLAALDAHFDADVKQISAAIDAFLDDLITNDLVRTAEIESVGIGQAELEQPDIVQRNGRGDFTAPVLTVYSDMQDLLLLDPIHDVDEGGWPTPRQAKGGD